MCLYVCESVCVCIHALQNKVSHLLTSVAWFGLNFRVSLYFHGESTRTFHFFLSVRRMDQVILQTCSLCSVAPACPSLCDPVDCSPPGSSVHGIYQARIMEWVATSSSRGSSWPRYWTWVTYISCIGRRLLYLWAMGLPSADLGIRKIICFSSPKSHLPWQTLS